NVNIPNLADRQIYIPLDLNLSCDGWQTGNGVVRIAAVPGPASIEGGNILEDIVFARDFITAQVKANFSAPSAFSQTLPNSPCVTIGASPSTGPSDAFTFIAYDAPIRKSIGGVAAIPRLEITFT